jgi:hypothetical protein
LEQSDGHDQGSVDNGIPGVTAVIDDFVAGFEDSVGEPVDACTPPDIFGRFIASVLQAGGIKAAPFSMLRADGSEDVGRGGALIPRSAQPECHAGPTCV